MSEMPDLESNADRIVASLHNVDEKVNALREQRINDPDDLCDKIFKAAAPRWPDLCSANCSNWHGTSRLAAKPYYRTAPPTNARNWR